jgi:hypothetical protein
MNKLRKYKTIPLLIKVEDITLKILSELSLGMTEQEKEIKIKDTILKIKEEAIGDTHCGTKAYSIFLGNRYILYILKYFLIFR